MVGEGEVRAVCYPTEVLTSEELSHIFLNAEKMLSNSAYIIVIIVLVFTQGFPIAVMVLLSVFLCL